MIIIEKFLNRISISCWFFRFEVFDDDGKEGPDKKDDLIGTCWQSMRLVEAFSLRQA